MPSTFSSLDEFISGSASKRRATGRAVLLSLCTLLSLGATAATGQIATTAKPSPDAAIPLGTFPTGAATTSSVPFTDGSTGDVLTSVTFDPGPGGVQEFSNVTVTGCIVNTNQILANFTCHIDFTLNPEFTGPRQTVLRIVTTKNSVAWGVLYHATGSQVAFTPGAISGIPLNTSGEQPQALAVDYQGNIYFADPAAFTVKKWTASTQTVTAIAGTGAAGDTGDNGPPLSAEIGSVQAIAVAPNGDLYFLGQGTPGHVAVRRIDFLANTITTEAMVPAAATATTAQDLVVDALGRVYVSFPSLGYVDTFEGGNEINVVAGDDQGMTPQCGTMTAPGALALHPSSGLLFIADGARIVETTPNKNTLACTGIAVVAGTGTPGYSEGGGSATLAEISADITGLATAGDLLYIADAGNFDIRQVETAVNVISTIAGDGAAGHRGDGGPATSARLDGMGALALDPRGDLYLADSTRDQARKITVSTGALDFGKTPVGQTSANSPRTVTVTDSGNRALLLTAPLTGTNPAITDGYSIVPTGTCPLLPGAGGNSLAVGASCTVQVDFTPTVHGPNPGTLTFTDNAFSQTQAVDLSGTGEQANAFVAPNFISFVNTPVGTTANAWTATLNNTSAFNLDIKKITVSDPDFAFTTTCGPVLVAYSTCDLYIAFSPNAAKFYSATLTVHDDAVGGNQTITLNGTGTPNPITVIASPTNVPFTNTPVGSTSNPWTINISNESGQPALISSIKLSDSTDFKFTDYCGPYLAAYSSCTELVYFTPQQVGYVAGTLTITSNGSPSKLVVQLNGTGTSSALTIVASPIYVAFGNQVVGTTSNSWSINVSNESGKPALLSSIYLSDSGNFKLTNDCGPNLAAYSSCTLLVYFTPQQVGYVSGTLTIADNGSPSTQVIQLNGTGTSNKPTAFVSPISINFGNQPVGVPSNAWTATLNNTSSTPLTIVSMGMSNTAFSYTTTCGSTVPANSTCYFYIQFTPTYVGQATGALNIYDNTQGGYEGISLTGYGTSSTPVVQLAPTSVNFNGQTVNTTSNPWTLNFSNESGAPVTISGIVLSDTKDFSYTSYCGSTVAAYSSCTILAYFTPQNTLTYYATLTVNSSGAPAAVTAYLNGWGTATPAAMGYLISVSPAALTMKAGQSATAAFSFSPYGGYTGTASFGCSGLPAGLACQFSPATLTANGSNAVQTSHLTIATVGVSSLALNHGAGGTSRSIFWGSPVFLLGLLLTRRRKAPRRLLAALFAFTLLAAASGCGSTAGTSVTPIGASAITVTATGTAAATGTGTSAGATPAPTAVFTLTVTE